MLPVGLIVNDPVPEIVCGPVNAMSPLIERLPCVTERPLLNVALFVIRKSLPIPAPKVCQNLLLGLSK
jgi:hypothetical protein